MHIKHFPHSSTKGWRGEGVLTSEETKCPPHFSTQDMNLCIYLKKVMNDVKSLAGRYTLSCFLHMHAPISYQLLILKQYYELQNSGLDFAKGNVGVWNIFSLKRSEKKETGQERKEGRGH